MTLSILPPPCLTKTTTSHLAIGSEKENMGKRIKKDTPNKARAHIPYNNAAGQRVVGVSTIVGLLNKPQLITWANNLGLQGIDSNKYRDDKAEIGTLGHALIVADLKGETIDLSEYSPKQVDAAENAYLHWLDWRKGKLIRPILIEHPLVSETFQYGGRLDFYGWIDDVLALLDYKTGGIFREAKIQAAGGYLELLLDNGYERPEKVIILGIPRDANEQFHEVTITDYIHSSRAFHFLRATYAELKHIK